MTINGYYPETGRDGLGRVFCRACWTLLASGFLLGMSYLWLYSQVMQASSAVQSFESRAGHLRGQSVNLQSRLEALQSPASITGMLEQREIALTDPEPSRIVRVRQQEVRGDRDPARAGSPGDLVILSIAR